MTELFVFTLIIFKMEKKKERDGEKTPSFHRLEGGHIP